MFCGGFEGGGGFESLSHREKSLSDRRRLSHRKKSLSDRRKRPQPPKKELSDRGGRKTQLRFCGGFEGLSHRRRLSHRRGTQLPGRWRVRFYLLKSKSLYAFASCGNVCVAPSISASFFFLLQPCTCFSLLKAWSILVYSS